jgi:uncharacterized protein involved in type VI secretion and phage assembly
MKFGANKVGAVLARESQNKVYGVVVGIVTNITQDSNDSQGHRIKVRFPWLPNGDSEESDWARCISVGAGKKRGFFCLPEVDDEVLVAFENGDIARPYILGTLWNGKDSSTYDNKDGKNNKRAFTSRSGHVLEFDDTDGKEKVTIKTKAGAYLCLDDKDKILTLQDHAGDNHVVVDQKNKKVSIESSSGDILIKAKGDITLDSKTITLKSSGDTTSEAGANFKMKASSNMELKASGTGDIESSGAMTIKGSKVNIN